jgi:hypothetical protein
VAAVAIVTVREVFFFLDLDEDLFAAESEAEPGAGVVPAAVEASDPTTEASAASGLGNGSAAGITSPGAALVVSGTEAGMEGAGAVVVRSAALIDDMVKSFVVLVGENNGKSFLKFTDNVDRVWRRNCCESEQCYSRSETNERQINKALVI